MKTKIGKFFLILTVILLLISSILAVDTSHYYKYIQLIVYILVSSYFIIKLIKKETVKVIKTKLDICIILLVISTIIPMIFNTYVSLEGTIKHILQYTYMLAIYFILRELTYKNKTAGRVIINIFIVSGIINVFIGIDGITFNGLEKILKYLEIVLEKNGDNRVVSTYGYANVCAIYLASILFLNIGQYLSCDRKIIKATYKTITLILFIGIILTYSRAVFVILGITLIVYIFFIIDKKKKNQVIQNIIISLIITIIFNILFEQNFNKSEYINIWIILAITVIIDFIINIALEKINLCSLNSKIMIISAIITLGIGISYIVNGLFVYKEFLVFDTTINSDYRVKVINNVKGNTKYLLEFEIESKAIEEFRDVYKIKVIEKDIKNQEIKFEEMNFGEFNGKKTIEFSTADETTELRIEFYLNGNFEKKFLNIKSLEINNKKYPLEYKYLPTKLVEKLRSISFNYKTMQERKAVILDAIELSRKTFLFGIGGEGWKYKYKEVQDYNYTVNQIHSYPAKVVLEFGAIGLIAWLGLIVVLLKQLLTNKNIISISILFSIIIIIIHSIIDMDMEYIHILIYMFGLTGIISNELVEIKKSNNSIKILNGIIILVMFVSIYLKINTKIYNRQGNIVELLRARDGLKVTSIKYMEINYKIAQEYEKMLLVERYEYIQNYNNIFKYYLESNVLDKEHILEKYYEKIKIYNNKFKNDEICILQKFEVIKNILEFLEKEEIKYKEIRRKFANIILDEYDETKKYLEECIRKKHQVTSEEFIELERIYKFAKKVVIE